MWGQDCALRPMLRELRGFAFELWKETHHERSTGEDGQGPALPTWIAVATEFPFRKVIGSRPLQEAVPAGRLGVIVFFYLNYVQLRLMYCSAATMTGCPRMVSDLCRPAPACAWRCTPFSHAKRGVCSRGGLRDVRGEARKSMGFHPTFEPSAEQPELQLPPEFGLSPPQMRLLGLTNPDIGSTVEPVSCE